MSDKELQSKMSMLYEMLKTNKLKPQEVIGKAVQLGMEYQENKIKCGIKIIFDELHNKG